MNLCTNAARAMRKKGGILEISLSEVKMGADASTVHPDISPGDYLRLTLSDTGHGMAPDVLARIFDPYFSTKEKGRGTGLGLSVVHGIVKSHGGAVTVHSKAGKGTTFHLFLPLLDYAGEIEEEIEKVEPVPAGRERILFVDDEKDMIFLARQFLEFLGYEVSTSTNGIEAFELFRQQPDRFDLIITDMIMPGMTGEKLVKQIKKVRGNIPIILSTGFGITKQKAKKMGVKEVLMKPFVDVDLAKAVRKALD